MLVGTVDVGGNFQQIQQDIRDVADRARVMSVMRRFTFCPGPLMSSLIASGPVADVARTRHTGNQTPPPASLLTISSFRIFSKATCPNPATS